MAHLIPPSKTHPLHPPGFALLFTLVAIVLISGLVTATMFRVTENSYLARLTTLKLHVMAESERRLRAVVADPSLFALVEAPIGTTQTSTVVEGNVTTVVTLTKVDSALLWVVANASTHQGRFTAAHRTGVSATLTASFFQAGRPLLGPAWVDLY